MYIFSKSKIIPFLSLGEVFSTCVRFILSDGNSGLLWRIIKTILYSQAEAPRTRSHTSEYDPMKIPSLCTYVIIATSSPYLGPL